MTNKNVINAGHKTNFIKRMFVKKVRRAIALSQITSITYSEISNYFILHVMSEYDYLLSTPQRDEMIEAILYARRMMNLEQIPFYMTDEVELYDFCRYEDD